MITNVDRSSPSYSSASVAPATVENAAPVSAQKMNQENASNSTVALGTTESRRGGEAQQAVRDMSVMEGYGSKANEAARSPEAQWSRHDNDYRAYASDKARYDEDKAAWDRYQADLAAWQKACADNAKANASIDRKIVSLERQQLLIGAAETVLGLGGSILADGITRDELEAIARGEFGFLHKCPLDEHSVGQMKSAAQALIDNPALLEKLMSNGNLTSASKQTAAASLESALEAERDKRVTDDPAPPPPPAGNPGNPPRPPTPPTCKRPDSMGPMPTLTSSTSSAATGSTGSTGSAGSTGSSSGASGSAATSSTTGPVAPGWAGVLDKVQGGIDRVNDRLDRLATLEAKDARGEKLTDDEAKELKELRTQEKHLTRQLTDMANRMKMYTELMSAMSKLFSDISRSIIGKIG